MGMVLIDKKAFDEICSHLLELEKINRFCSPHTDLASRTCL